MHNGQNSIPGVFEERVHKKIQSNTTAKIKNIQNIGSSKTGEKTCLVGRDGRSYGKHGMGVPIHLLKLSAGDSYD